MGMSNTERSRLRRERMRATGDATASANNATASTDATAVTPFEAVREHRSAAGTVIPAVEGVAELLDVPRRVRGKETEAERIERMLGPVVESIRAGSKPGDFERYTLWNAAKKLYGELTHENWPFIKHGDRGQATYPVCKHDRRYCLECGTAKIPQVYAADSWGEAHEIIASFKKAKDA